ALDGLDGLQTIHSRHEMVHENRIGPIGLQIFNGLLGRLGHVDFDVVLFEHAAEDDASRLGVVDDQCAFASHEISVAQSFNAHGHRAIRPARREVATTPRVPVRSRASGAAATAHAYAGSALCDSLF